MLFRSEPVSGDYTTDRSVDLLLQQLSDCSGSVLIVADENWTLTDWTGVGQTQHCAIDVITNRIDVANNAAAAGVSCHFSDFDFSQLPADRTRVGWVLGGIAESASECLRGGGGAKTSWKRPRSAIGS